MKGPQMKELEWSQHYNIFFRRSKPANSVVRNGIWTKFELIQAFMAVLITCKDEEDPFKNEGATVVTFHPL